MTLFLICSPAWAHEYIVAVWMISLYMSFCYTNHFVWEMWCYWVLWWSAFFLTLKKRAPEMSRDLAPSAWFCKPLLHHHNWREASLCLKNFMTSYQEHVKMWSHFCLAFCCAHISKTVLHIKLYCWAMTCNNTTKWCL